MSPSATERRHDAADFVGMAHEINVHLGRLGERLASLEASAKEHHGEVRAAIASLHEKVNTNIQAVTRETADLRATQSLMRESCAKHTRDLEAVKSVQDKGAGKVALVSVVGSIVVSVVLGWLRWEASKRGVALPEGGQP
jgi:predicted ATP-binding protein involved in virulence